MRIPALVVALATFASVPLMSAVSSTPSLGCGGTVTSGVDAGGSTFPVDDGSMCGCATPDCLPSCSDLPPCKIVCTGGVLPDGAVSGAGPLEEGGPPTGSLAWVDMCGVIQYAENCPNGCESDAAAATCQ